MGMESILAPAAIQSRSRATLVSPIAGPLGGMLGFLPETCSTSALSSGLPATNAGPLSPPRRKCSSTSKRSLPSALSPEWQLQQCCRKIGQTCLAKLISSAALADEQASEL